jgi:hypothetical protein
MKKIAKQTLQEIKLRFKTEKGYVLTGENPIFCPQVNGLTNICLAMLGFSEEAKKNCLSFLRSPSFNAKIGLFHKEVNLEGKIIAPDFNSCKNAVFALALALNGFNKEAEEIMTNLGKSSVFIKEKGLFGKEFNPETGEVNSLVITQSNLWAALAFSSLGRIKEARQIMKSLEEARFDSDCKLFASIDCSNGKSKIFVDDQALAILTHLKIGEEQKAKDLAKAVLNSPLRDTKSGLFNSSFSDNDVDTTKSTYKNSLMTFALKALGCSKELRRVQQGLVGDLHDSEEKLFNQSDKDETKIPDNSALAVAALID